MALDERVLERLMKLEAGRMNDALVRRPRRLRELLQEDEPVAPTREGEVHVFDRAVLERLADRLSPLVRSGLRLPILFYVGHQDPHDAYVLDRTAIQALHQLGATTTEERNGKLWMGRALAVALANEWPTVVQFVRV